MNKYRCQNSVRRKCDVGATCDGIYYGEDCNCAKTNEKEGEQPTATNFQRHFGTAEKAAEFLNLRVECQACPMDYCNGLASNKKCEKLWIDWLNAPAEDENE